MHIHRRKRNRLYAHCQRCRHKQVFVKATINHLMHLILTVFTAGLWLVSWFAVCIGQKLRPWRCEHCGWREPLLGAVCTQTTKVKLRRVPFRIARVH